ncbi:MAG: hypothetical protein WB800_36680, partial [Streptosporangiaceae bacterium]
PTGAHTVTGAQSPAYTVSVSVSVAVVRAGPAGHHTSSIPTPDGLTQPLADHVGVRQPRGNAYA